MTTHSFTQRSPSVKILQHELAVVIDWIDRELSEEIRFAASQRLDLLLELRSVFSQGVASRAIATYYKLLPRLNRTHFLLGYRIRKWLALHFTVNLEDPLERCESRIFQLPLDSFLLQKIKTAYVEKAISCGASPSDTRLTFRPKNKA